MLSYLSSIICLRQEFLTSWRKINHQLFLKNKHDAEKMQKKKKQAVKLNLTHFFKVKFYKWISVQTHRRSFIITSWINHWYILTITSSFILRCKDILGTRIFFCRTKPIQVNHLLVFPLKSVFCKHIKRRRARASWVSR